MRQIARLQKSSPRGAVPGGMAGHFGPSIRLKYILMLVGLISLISWNFSNRKEAEASEPPPSAWGWSVTEIPVAQGPGDQKSPAVDGSTAVYNDLNRSSSGWVVKKDIFEGEPEAVAAAGVVAGPDIDNGGIVWQKVGYQVCRRDLSGSSDECIATSRAGTLALSGMRAIVSQGGASSTIRLMDFGTLSSKILDSYNYSGYRHSPDIDGDKTVWIRERGYAGRYYEPLVYSYDLKTGASGYLTKAGGGMNSGGASKYGRQHLTLSGGRVLYQQKLNETGQTWDIYEAVPETFGVGVVEEAGDQMNPSLSGNLVVYQDNRTGGPNDSGRWTGEWNIYMKDLDTGIEQPICTAPGDQINPVIKGNTVVWQDNRDGNWDVYAAVLSPATDDSRLMERFAPSLVLHQSEDFAPEDAGVMVSTPGSTLMEDGVEKLRAPGTLSLESLGDYGNNAYIDLPGKCLICGMHLPDPAFDMVIRSQFVRPYRDVIAGGGHDEAVYGRVVHLGGRTVIQYWINYYFNNHPMLSHEGDWELVEVELDAGMQPSRVSASQHSYGKMRQWQDVETRDGHPVIYVGRGSHANYFEPGNHSIEVLEIPDPMIIDEADSHDNGRVIMPRVLPLPGSILSMPGYRWLNFSGHWGEVNGIPEADPPPGPPWSGDRWRHPLAWQGLEWDGLAGMEGKLVGLEARVSRAVRISLSGVAGSVGDNLAGAVEDRIPGSQFFDVEAVGKKVISVPSNGNPFECQLKITAGQTVSTPLQLSFADPKSGSFVSLNYSDIPVGPGTVAGLAIGPAFASTGYAVQVDNNGDGIADITLVPDSVTRTNLDSTPPSAITDLRAERQSDGAVMLGWTAPGDNGDEGAATMYSIRYATQPITEHNWVAAEPVAVNLRPLNAGAIESLTINDLAPGKAVYFAARATDEAGNESPISNPAPSSQPRLMLSVGSVFWGSYADYLNGDLTVRYRLNNRGDGPAREVAVRQVITNPAAVVPGTMPATLAGLEIGQSADVEIRFRCPAGTRRFTTRLYASCVNEAGEEMWFPGLPPATA